MSTFWHIVIVVAILGVGIGLLAASGGETPSTKRADASLRLMAYEAYEKNDGDVPIVMMNGVLMHMDRDGHWVKAEKVDGQE